MASAEERTCAQDSLCEEGPKRLGLRESCRGANLLGEHYPKLLRVGSGQEEGVLPEPSCPPHCPRNECSMSGETGKVKKPGSLHPRSHQEGEADTPVAEWVTRESLLGRLREHRRLVHAPVFAARGDQMCVWQKHSQARCQVLPTLPVPPPRFKHKGYGFCGFMTIAGQNAPKPCSSSLEYTSSPG